MIADFKHLDHRIKKIFRRSDRFFRELDEDIDRKTEESLQRIDGY